MAFTDVLGRLALVLIFVVAGGLKFVETDMYAGLLTDGYSKLNSLLVTSCGMHLPLNPALVAVHSKNLIFLTGAIQILGSMLTVLRIRLGCWMIILLLILFDVVIHNPFFYASDVVQQVFHARMAILNIGILGGFVLALSGPARTSK